ncbi:redoxin family protein [Flavobacterium sp. ST-75]|uniref:Redoxin family protein n=1 Tax=Flavobacterium rhizophilum TaxID=3163296 RepID=A0ABW8YGK3_9FLAO
MQNFITALKAEHLKRKKTGIYLTAIILGAFIPLIYAIAYIIQNETLKPGLPYNIYVKTLEIITGSFTDFFLPLLILISASRLTQLDHKNGGWQLMETQPLKKTSIYFAKYTQLILVTFVSILAFITASYLGSVLISLFIDIPDNVSVSFDFGLSFWLMVRMLLAALLFASVQYAVSVLLPSFIWSMLIGLFLLLGYMIAVNFQVFPDWFPLETLKKAGTYPKGSDLGYWITYSEVISVLSSFIVLYIGFMWYKYKSAKKAFVNPAARIGALAGVLIVFGGATWYMTTSNTMSPYSKTVISGTIESTTPIDKIYLADNFMGDTLAEINISEGKFHQVINNDFPLDIYHLKIGQSIANVILSNKDSIFVKLRINKEKGEIDYYGTRIAENQYIKNKRENLPWSSVAYDLDQNRNLDKPAKFIDHLISEWKESINKSDNFKTVDNYVPREDYKLQNKKLLTITYLNYWNDFVKKRKALYPEEKTEPTEEIKEMIATVPLNDEGLLSNEDYFTYLKTQIIAENKEEVDENTKTLQAIEKMEKGSFRDKMLYWQLDKSVKEASNNEERNSTLAKYSGLFTQNNYVANLNATNKLYASLEAGKAAPQFEAIDKDQKVYTLNDLKGKYVVMDVWATWCGPCERERPSFEKMAIKYKNEPVQFVAVSMDRRIEDWYVEVNNRSKSVLQLHINDISKFSKEYNTQSIPRFILIDPDGNFVNSQLPFPSDANFEKMLRDALGLEEEK